MMAMVTTLMIWFGMAIICVCLAVVAFKVIYTIGIPYDAVFSDRREHGTSPFLPFIEIVLVCFAAFTSWCIGPIIWLLRPAFILIYGLGAVLTSYLHFCAVLFIAGLVLWVRDRKASHPRDRQ